MKFAVALILLLLLSLLLNADAWWWGRRKSNCPKRSGAKPYYFGTTNLSCMMSGGKKGKRSAPSRSTLRWAHRFIYYDGHYFEFVVGEKGAAIYGRTAAESYRCSSRRESKPAGYSTITVDCLKRCTNNYKSKYGGYSFLFNNCHHYANVISGVLCNNQDCPSWC